MCIYYNDRSTYDSSRYSTVVATTSVIYRIRRFAVVRAATNCNEAGCLCLDQTFCRLPKTIIFPVSHVVQCIGFSFSGFQHVAGRTLRAGCGLRDDGPRG